LKIHFTRKARIIDIYSAHIIKMYPNQNKPLCNSVHLVYDAQLFSETMFFYLLIVLLVCIHFKVYDY